MANKKIIIHPIVNGVQDNTTNLYPKTNISQVENLETTLNGKQATLVSGTNIKTINSQSILGSGNIEIGGSATSVETTYSALKSLRDNSQLVPGTWYRITDYTTTTTQTNTSSAGHQFDIIVKADSVNKLNENAYATQHAGNTYFASSDLSAWQLWYSLDNDTTKFAWADSTNGKGVIYRMIDEFGNDCPYDFKNIKFKRYLIDTCQKIPSLVGKYLGIKNIPDYIVDEADFIWCYTFTWINDSDEVEDCSIVGQTLPDDGGQYVGVFGNIIKECSAYDFSDEPEGFGFALNDIVIQATYDYEGGIFYGIYGNTFGNNCHHNSFGNDCSNNSFGDSCDANLFGNSCFYNVFGDSCDANLFGNSCGANLFGNDCYGNILNGGCGANLFGNGCSGNLFGDSCRYNSFGNDCGNNSFGNFCNNNSFGNSCDYNSFGDSSSTINWVQYIIIDSGCKYLYINSNDTASSGSNILQNIHIHLGVKGSASTNRKIIRLPDRNLPYETNVYMDENGNIELVINSGGGGSSTAEAISYTTTAPSANNPTGLKFVILEQEPATRYNGYYYIITGGSGQVADEALTTSEINSMWSGS